MAWFDNTGMDVVRDEGAEVVAPSGLCHVTPCRMVLQILQDSLSAGFPAVSTD